MRPDYDWEISKMRNDLVDLVNYSEDLSSLTRYFDQLQPDEFINDAEHLLAEINRTLKSIKKSFREAKYYIACEQTN